MSRYQTLVPRPVEVRPAPGTFELTRETPLVAAPGAEAAADLVRLLLAPLRLPLRPASAGAGLVVRLDPEVEPEGYRLRVAEDGIALVASTLDGVRHGTQTLRQLLPDAAWRAVPPPGARWVVECGEVVDAPVLAWRGGMIDVARHFFGKHTILRYVDLFAMHRLNRMHLHLTDDQGWRIESRRYPRLAEVASHRPRTQAGWYEQAEDDGTPHGGYYTLDDLAEIASYAAERGVTVVPEIDLPGHASALLAAYPELGNGMHAVRTGWGISTGVLNPVPATVRFIADVVQELTEAVPGSYIHLGGDECPVHDCWGVDPEVLAYQRELGYPDPVGLFGHFMRELGGVLSRHGRRMVVWDEAFVGGGLLADSVVTAWRGDAVAQRAAAAGYDVVRCPVFPTYFDYGQSDHPDEPLSIGGPITLADVASFEPVPHSWTDQEAAHVLGAQFQAWSEYIPDAAHLDYMVFPRACAFAEVTWAGRPAAADFEQRLPAHLSRLDAAGCRYRPPSGPLPWQAGGTGHRRRTGGTPIAKVREHLDSLAERADVPPDAATTN
jgi:hexosaminidase